MSKESDLLKKIEEDSLYLRKMALIPSYILGGLSILSLILIAFFTDSSIIPTYLVFIYLGMMILTVLSIMWPGFAFANYMLKRKNNKK